jgi:hypothetical protein
MPAPGGAGAHGYYGGGGCSSCGGGCDSCCDTCCEESCGHRLLGRLRGLCHRSSCCDDCCTTTVSCGDCCDTGCGHRLFGRLHGMFNRGSCCNDCGDWGSYSGCSSCGGGGAYYGGAHGGAYGTGTMAPAEQIGAPKEPAKKMPTDTGTGAKPKLESRLQPTPQLQAVPQGNVVAEPQIRNPFDQ